MMVEVKGKKTTFNDIVNKIGFPTIFIGGFWVLLLIGALGISVITMFGIAWLFFFVIFRSLIPLKWHKG
jgi:hypothetical protein